MTRLDIGKGSTAREHKQRRLNRVKVKRQLDSVCSPKTPFSIYEDTDDDDVLCFEATTAALFR